MRTNLDKAKRLVRGGRKAAGLISRKKTAGLPKDGRDLKVSPVFLVFPRGDKNCRLPESVAMTFSDAIIGNVGVIYLIG